jgi:hypothetical protein
MTLSLGSEYDKAVGGLWIEENATSVVPSLPESPKVLPIGFTAEYRVLAEVCASMSSGFMLLNRSERVTYSNKNALHLLQLERAERVHIQHFDVRQHLLSLATDPRHVKPDLDQAWQHPEQESATDLSLFDAATQWLRVRSFPVRDNERRAQRRCRWPRTSSKRHSLSSKGVLQLYLAALLGGIPRCNARCCR